MSSNYHTDECGAYINIQTLRLDDIVVDDDDLKSFLFRWEVLDQLSQLRTTHTIGTVNGQTAIWLLALQGSLEGLAKLLIVSDLGGLAVLIPGALGIQTPHNIV